MKSRFLLFCALLSAHAAALAADAAPNGAPHDLQSWCRDITRVIPKVKLNACTSADLQPWAKSVKLRDIMLHESLPAHTPVGRILVVGGIHGDELTSVSVVFRWIEQLKQRTGEAARYRWRVIPVLNPDGLLAKPPTRVNARGVDLNRNFPTTNWANVAHQHWTVHTGRDPRRFPGPAPRSEPESSWFNAEIMTFQPDVIISIHAPYGILDFDAPVGVRPPAQFGPLKLHELGVYPGSLGNYGARREGIPVVTLELPHALDMPSEDELAQVWRDMQEWLKRHWAERKARPAP